ncbi:MAG: NAD(P)/FAD-dependent oxidoreductase [Candidatus Arcticimaribacter sp.]
MEEIKKVAVIGGGAAGFFAALSVAEHHPSAQITLYEKSSKVLSKEKVSGGGRCNVTHDCTDIPTLIQAYPRGGKQLKSIFHSFQPKDTIAWFNARGVTLKTEKDGRMFPVTDDSQTIIDCLESACDKLGIQRQLNSGVEKISCKEEQWTLQFKNGSIQCDAVIITTGGSPKAKGFDWLANLDHSIIPPVPSLFTFNMPKEDITQLMGVVAKKAKVHIIGSKIKTEGPLLITHWGMSGPAILKASSMGARALAECDYRFSIRVQWLEASPQELLNTLEQIAKANPQKQIGKLNPFEFPNRLWVYLLQKIKLAQDRRWNEVGQKNFHRLIDLLTNDNYTVEGKTTFKEEFVTCGGISLKDINMKTMESKKAKGLYFAGEVLDIDAITGGYNFQAAWSGGYVAGKLQ